MKKILEACDGLLYEVDTDTSTKILEKIEFNEYEKRIIKSIIYLSKNKKIYYRLCCNKIEYITKEDTLKELLKNNVGKEVYINSGFIIYEG